MARGENGNTAILSTSKHTIAGTPMHKTSRLAYNFHMINCYSGALLPLYIRYHACGAFRWLLASE